MTQFETSQFGTRSRLEQGFNIDTPGIRGSLTAPGLEPTPPVSRSAEQLDRLAQSLGLVGQVADQAGVIVRREAARTRAEQEEAERMERAIEQVQRGIAVRDFKANTESFKNGFDNGDFDTVLDPDPDQQSRNIEALIEQFVGKEQSEAYQQAFFNEAFPFFANQAAKREQSLRKEILQENAAILRDRFSIAESPEEMNEVLEAFRNLQPNLSETEALNQIVAPQFGVLQSQMQAVETLDQMERISKQFENIVKVLDGRLISETQIAGARLIAAGRAAQERIENGALEELSARKLNGASFDSLREFVIQLNNDGRLSARAADRAIEAIDADERRLLGAAGARLREEERKFAIEQLVTQAVAAIQNEDQIPLEQTIVLSTGEEVTLTDDELIKMAMPIVLGAIDQTSRTQEEAFFRRVITARRYNQTDPRVEQTIQSGFNQSSVWMVSLDGKTIPTDPPPILIEALNEFMSLGQIDVTTQMAHVPNEDAQEFFTMAQVAFEKMGRSQEQALITAATALQSIRRNGLQPFSAEARTAIDTAVKNARKEGNRFFVNDPESFRNEPEIRAAIKEVARVIMAMGIPAEPAVEEAAKLLKGSVVRLPNGWGVFRAGQQLPNDFDKVADLIIRSYVEKFGKATGLTRDELTLKHVGGGRWRLVEAVNGLPVPESVSLGIFDPKTKVKSDQLSAGEFATGDFWTISNLINKPKIEEAAERREEAQRNLVEGKNDSIMKAIFKSLRHNLTISVPDF